MNTWQGSVFDGILLESAKFLNNIFWLRMIYYFISSFNFEQFSMYFGFILLTIVWLSIKNIINCHKAKPISLSNQNSYVK